MGCLSETFIHSVSFAPFLRLFMPRFFSEPLRLRNLATRLLSESLRLLTDTVVKVNLASLVHHMSPGCCGLVTMNWLPRIQIFDPMATGMVQRL